MRISVEAVFRHLIPGYAAGPPGDRSSSRSFAFLVVRRLGGVSLPDLLPERSEGELFWNRRLPRRLLTTTLLLLLLLGLTAGLIHELRTSALQSSVWHRYASRLTYSVGAGPSSEIEFPRHGPFNTRVGYSRLPDFQARLQAAGFQVSEQARFSPELKQAVDLGLSPPFRPAADAGLLILDENEKVLYDTRPTARLFKDLDEVPPLLLRSLLFFEDRRLIEPTDVRTNPVMDWNRFAKAGLLYGGGKLGLRIQQQGGSTLATQIEKYQHSEGGRTASVGDKLLQMAGASLKVYRESRDTQAERERIILHYLNTVPLAAVPGQGEVIGVGNGLHAWFDLDLPTVRERLDLPEDDPAMIRTFKNTLALVAAIRAPSFYLIENRKALVERVDAYTRLMARAGLLSDDFAAALLETPVTFAAPRPLSAPPETAHRKSVNTLRTDLTRHLGVPGFYELDRLDLKVRTTLDSQLQHKAFELLENLRDPAFLAANGLMEWRLLAGGDPSEVIYSLLLYERTPDRNLLRVHLDSLDRPFDLNEGMKLELGSTAKLRTLAHYLEIVALLHAEFSETSPEELTTAAASAADPLTRWAVDRLRSDPETTLESFLKQALERRYSAATNETFFTGGGRHTFRNFDPSENSMVLTVRQATVRSTNLVFIRLMRDLVRYHQARLPYDPGKVLSDRADPDRLRLLEEIAEQESRQDLARFFRGYRGRTSDEIVERLLGTRISSPRHLAMAYFAWNPGAAEEGLGAWLRERGLQVTDREVARLTGSFGAPHLNISDFGYLLGRHTLEVWTAGQLLRNPELSWVEALTRSEEARRTSSRWLFQTRSRRAQDIRLRARIEVDSFRAMTPYWRNWGFPFEQLVPSLATALGSSSDRPAALAEMMGIILNDGLRLQSENLEELRFAEKTPYHTVLRRQPAVPERVAPAEVAGVLREVLAEVVTEGTGRRLRDAFFLADGTPVISGGKTGSGDNRHQTFARGGQLLSSRHVNRTATYVFYVGDRYFGVVTAFVPGDQAERHNFTSALPAAILRLLAPALNDRLQPAFLTRSRYEASKTPS